MPGSHRLGHLQHTVDKGHYHLDVDEWPLKKAVPCEAGPGDVLFFSYLCVHGSTPNRHATEARTSVLVQMRDPSDRSIKPEHLSRGQGMMLRGVDPTTASGTSVEGPRLYRPAGAAPSPSMTSPRYRNSPAGEKASRL